jgi:membrane associated rhomboid family serine protease
MGLNDRDYARYDQQPGFHVGAPQSATVQIIVATVAVYIAQLVIPELTNWGELDSNWYLQPWKVYTLLTYGFLHSAGPRGDVAHIVLNMLALWFMGRDVEQRYGKREFLAIYLCGIVVAGLGWSLCESLLGSQSAVIGASGAIAAIVVLFALNFAHRTVLFMFVIPMRAWVFGAIVVAMDAYQATKRSGDVAYTAHLAGAAFGAAYYFGNLQLAGWLTSAKNWLPNRSRPRLRVHEPDDPETPEDDLTQQVDDILRKIQEKGQDSLTRSERQLLERASREFQQKRK